MYRAAKKKKTYSIKQRRTPFKRKHSFGAKILSHKFGPAAFFCLFQARVEYVYLRLIRRVVRLKYKKRKSRFYRARYWIRFTRNLYLTKKSKNARMGSGNGKFVRTAFVIAKHASFMEFKRFHAKYLICLLRRLRFKIPMKFFVNVLSIKDLT